MSPSEKSEEETKVGAQSALGKITQAGYSSLDVCFHLPLLVTGLMLMWWYVTQLIRYFTCGPDEVRAWTIRKGTKAPQAAGVIQLRIAVISFLSFG
jgi:obg-like ATPase 1